MSTTSDTPSSPKVVFKEPTFAARRGSRASVGSGSSTSSTAIDEHYEDWTTTTAEKDTWASRERRRSLGFHKIDNYPATGLKAPALSSSPTGPSGTERRGSILSLWTSGKDKDGKHILHSDGEAVHDWDLANKRVERGSKGHTERERRGSILSIFRNEKDAKGRSIVSSD